MPAFIQDKYSTQRFRRGYAEVNRRFYVEIAAQIYSEVEYCVTKIATSCGYRIISS